MESTSSRRGHLKRCMPVFGILLPRLTVRQGLVHSTRTSVTGTLFRVIVGDGRAGWAELMKLGTRWRHCHRNKFLHDILMPTLKKYNHCLNNLWMKAITYVVSMTTHISVSLPILCLYSVPPPIFVCGYVCSQQIMCVPLSITYVPLYMFTCNK